MFETIRKFGRWAHNRISGSSANPIDQLIEEVNDILTKANLEYVNYDLNKALNRCKESLDNLIQNLEKTSEQLHNPPLEAVKNQILDIILKVDGKYRSYTNTSRAMHSVKHWLATVRNELLAIRKNLYG